MTAAPATLYRHATLILAGLESRAIDTAPTADELALEVEYTAALEPLMRDLYLIPFRGGYDVPDGSDAQIRAWLLEQYERRSAELVGLLVTLRALIRRGVTVGGQGALTLLGLAGTFALTDATILAQIDRHVDDLLRTNGQPSLVTTTADELSRKLRDTEREERAAIVAVLAGSRSEIRALMTSNTEAQRAVNSGLLWGAEKNGVTEVIGTHRGTDVYCDECAGHIGVRYAIGRGPELPRHPFCHCLYVPVLTGWEPPVDVWTGGARI